MGMYTEFVCAMELNKNIPKEVVEILKFMVGDKNDIFHTPDHEFFKCTRWEGLFTMDSAYFSGDTNTILNEDFGYYSLTIRSNLKNYDSEIEKFLLWIKPYISPSQHNFLGYMRYEENDEPTLIYLDKITELNEV